jgi:serine/threonine-protein kinase
MAFQCIRCKTEIDKSYKACPHCGEIITDFLRTYSEAPIDGKYQIVERLGAGGMGEVYKVIHTFLGATRVVKVIRAQISENKDAHDRFLREAKIATKIHHPNVATLHDFSALPDGSHYMVWEYIDGEDVSKRIRSRGRLQPRYAVRVAIEAIHGLDGVHRAGIVHRDISPENIMITRDGDEERVKVIDLGVAKSEDPNENATRVGVFVGKLRYASPEHLGFLEENERIDGRADLYSMAMVLYEMLTGRPPFEATSAHEYVMLHSKETAFKPMDLPADLPGGAELQAVLKKALERDRNKRYANAREFAAALEQVERTLPDPRTQETMMGGAAEPTMYVTPAPMQQTKQDTLHRPTVRSEVIQPETIRTPLPGVLAAPVAGPTVIAAPNAAAATQHEIVARPRKGGGMAIIILAIIALLAIATIGTVLFLMKRQTGSEIAQGKPPITQTATAPPPASSANVDVQVTAPTGTITEIAPPLTETTATAPVLTASLPLQTTTGTPIAVPRRPEPQPRVIESEPPTPQPVPRPEPAPVASSSVRTYIDGDSGDSDVNDQILNDVKKQLQGVNQIAIRANSPEMKNALIDRLGRETALTVSDNATTVIEWDATYVEMGRGRKRRAATATVSKNGRVVFRYQLPSEDFRVGDTPAEAFTRVLAEAFSQ